MGYLAFRWAVMAVAAALLLPPIDAHAGEGDAAAAASAATVGRLSHPESLVFEGNETFTAKQILDGLRTDTDFLLASHPAAPRGEYVRLVTEKVRAGYMNCGFPDVRVEGALDAAAARLTLKIVEGPRYKCGEVRVVGAREIPAGKLVKLLTEPRMVSEYEVAKRGEEGKPPEPENPIWTKGAPAPFGALPQRRLTRLATQACSEFGNFAPQLEAGVVADPKSGTAELLVTIRHEGPRAVLGGTRVTGLVKSDEADLLELLELKPGMVIDRQAVNDINYRLWRSARFLSWTVTPSLPTKPGETRSTLAIDVVEYNKAPALGVELTREDQAMLKLRDWLAAFAAGEEDLVLTVEGQGTRRSARFQAIFSPRHGLLTACNMNVDGRVAISHGLAFDSKSLIMFEMQGRRRCTIPAGNMPLKALLSVVARSRPDKDGDCFFLGGNLSVSSELDHAANRHVVLQLDPVAFLALGRSKYLLAMVEDGILNLSAPGLPGVLKIDAATGRPLESSISGPGASLKVRLSKGAAGKALEKLGLSASDGPEAFDPKRPAGSSIGFLAYEVIQILRALEVERAPDERAGAALRKLLSRGALAPLDRLVTAGSRNTGKESFNVPEDVFGNLAQDAGTASKGLDPGAVNDRLMAEIGRALLFFGEQGLPRDSWAWTLGREKAFGLMGLGRYEAAEMKRLYGSPDLGPLGCLACARLSPVSPRPFARKGLERLTSAALLADLRPFLAKEAPLGESLRAVLEAARELTDEEAEALVSLLPPKDAPAAGQALTALRASKDKPLDEALPAMAEAAWKAGLRELLEKALREVVGRTPGLFDPE